MSFLLVYFSLGFSVWCGVDKNRYITRRHKYQIEAECDDCIIDSSSSNICLWRSQAKYSTRYAIVMGRHGHGHYQHSYMTNGFGGKEN